VPRRSMGRERTITIRTVRALVHSFRNVLQRIFLTGTCGVVIKATRIMPRAAIQEVAARTTVPWSRCFKDSLEKP
jgi:hypothetical protein